MRAAQEETFLRPMTLCGTIGFDAQFLALVMFSAMSHFVLRKCVRASFSICGNETGLMQRVCVSFHSLLELCHNSELSGGMRDVTTEGKMALGGECVKQNA